jgi:hypothetical protein
MPSTLRPASPLIGRSDAHELACILKYQFSHCTIEDREFFLVPRSRSVDALGAERGSHAIVVGYANDGSGLQFAKKGD